MKREKEKPMGQERAASCPCFGLDSLIFAAGIDKKKKRWGMGNE